MRIVIKRKTHTHTHTHIDQKFENQTGRRLKESNFRLKATGNILKDHSKIVIAVSVNLS